MIRHQPTVDKRYEVFVEGLRKIEGLVKSLFPLHDKSGKKVLEISDLTWRGLSKERMQAISEHKDARLKEQTIATSLIGNVVYKNLETGLIYDQKSNYRLMDVPHITNRDSFIVGGNEVQVVSQLRWRPGIYTKIKGDDLVQTTLNTSAAGSYAIVLDRQTGILRFKIGTEKKVPVVSLLRSLGDLEDSIRQLLGDLYVDNAKAAADKDLVTLFTTLRPHAPLDTPDLMKREAVQKFLESKPLNPEATKLTTGEKFDKIDLGAVRAAIQRTISVSEGHGEEDDVESLAFKDLYTYTDLVFDNLAREVRSSVKEVQRRMNAKITIDGVLPEAVLSGKVMEFFTTSEFSRYADQNNPVDMLAVHSVVTIMGQGGIGSHHAITDEVRQFHPSMIGVIDPVHVPEGSSIGTTLHLAVGAKRVGHNMAVHVTNAKTGQPLDITVQDLMPKVVAFRDQYEPFKDGEVPKARFPKVKVRHNTSFLEVDPGEVEYIFPKTSHMLSSSTNAIPFLNNNSPNRQLMANKHLEQTVQLLNPDKPIVQSEVEDGTSYQEQIAKLLTPTSPVNGVVEKVSKEEITIKGDDKKVYKVNLYNNYPLKSKTFLNDTPAVKAGQRVTEGQKIADHSFIEDGALALGKNLKIAFMPWKGLNTEDGMVVSQTAATKLTSVHKHEFRLEHDDTVKADLELLLSQFPQEYVNIRDREKRYTSDGIIKKGATVVKGDVLIPGVQLINTVGSSLSLLHKKSLSTAFKDVSEVWTKDVPGTVIDVTKTGKFIKVNVKANEPLIVGDKLSYSAAGKGIVIAVLPDHEMPHNAKGDAVEVLFGTPGILGRMNPGIIFEPLIGKALHKTKETYLAGNFNRAENANTVKDVEALMRKHRVTDTEDLIDPMTGKTIKGVLTGIIHTLKLKHQVDTKISARGANDVLPYTSLGAPKKESGESAQKVGFLDTFSLLSAGSTHLLNDMFGVKSGKNDAFWTAMKTGSSLPAPVVPYVTEKLMVDLMGAGINLTQRGSKISMSPLTDIEILRMSKGAITNPDTVRAKDMSEISGGLFDVKTTGGLSGRNFTHYTLASPVLNPLLKEAAASVGNFRTLSEMDDVLDGKRSVLADGTVTDNPKAGTTGAAGVALRLGAINVDTELARLAAEAPLLKGADKNKAYKRIQYLSALQEMGLRPEDAYVNKLLAVIPPRFRKVSELPDGTVSIADANHGYRQVILLSEKLKELKNLGVGSDHTKELELELQRAVAKHVGIEPGDRHDREFRGFVEAINGKNESKYGFLKKDVLSRQQDLSARSTIIVNPKLGLDQVGLPKQMAMTIYKPFILRSLVNSGYTPLDAKELVEKGDKRAVDVLVQEMNHRPVIINRAPSLHKFNTMAFRPTLIDGKAIEVNQPSMPGLGADLDGDQTLTMVVFSWSRPTLEVATQAWLGKGWSLGFSQNFDTSEEIQAFLDLRRLPMSARKQLTVPALDSNDELFIVDLADFPRTDAFEVSVGSQGNLIRWHAVPEGVRVMSYDDATGQMAWRPVTKYSVHVDCPVTVVSTHTGKTLHTDDDPRAIYGVYQEDGRIAVGRKTPDEAAKALMMIPVAHRLTPTDGCVTELSLKQYNKSEKSTVRQFKETVPLTPELGHFFGIMAGDGWASGNQVCLSNICSELVEAYVDTANTLFDVQPDHELTASRRATRAPGQLHGSYGRSDTWVLCSARLTAMIQDLIGVGAENKHLPPMFAVAPIEFRYGLLAGLIDTDGQASYQKAVSKNRAQKAVRYDSRSERLAREVAILSRSLGIRSGIGTYKGTNTGNDMWYLTFNAADVENSRLGEFIKHPDKARVIRSKDSVESSASARHDLVPVSPGIFKYFRKLLGAGGAASTHPNKPQLYGLAVSKTTYLSRMSARRLLEIAGEDFHQVCPDAQQWMGIVANDKVTWEYITDVQHTDIRVTGYDLTVPGYETFTSIEGVVLSNTVGVHVPVTEEARREMWDKLMANKHVLSPRDSGLVPSPTTEALYGIYKMTKPIGTPKDYTSKDAVLKDLKAGKIEVNHAIKIDGSIHCAGQYLVNDLFPEGYGPGMVEVTARNLKDKLARLASEKGSEAAAEVINHVKDMGFHYVTELGMSLSLKDLSVDTKRRDAVFTRAKARVAEVGFTQAAGEATKELDALLAEATNDIIDSTFRSGASSKSGSVRQMVAAPVAIQDAKGRAIPFFIDKAYAEGHDTGMYMASIPGSRQGLIDKGLTVADSGYLSRLLVSSNLENVITEDDCKTLKGITLPVDSPDVVDRFGAAGEYRNVALTPDVVRKLRASGASSILVRSPLTCQSHRGLCAMCYGLTETGRKPDIGAHVGATSAQSLGERSTQITLSCNAGENLITVLIPGSAWGCRQALESLWNDLNSEHGASEVDDVQTIQPTDVIHVWDGEAMVILESMQKHALAYPMAEINVSGGFSFKCQGNHPIYASREPFGPVEKLPIEDALGMYVLAGDSGIRLPSLIESIEFIPYDKPVYDVKTSTGRIELNGVQSSNSFHTGSAIGGQKVGLGRIKELLFSTSAAKGNAVLSSATGSVSKIVTAPSGGHFVYVDKDKHFIPRELGLGVAVGQAVSAGDRLTVGGSIRPKDVLETTGDMGRTQDALISELGKAYGGAKFKRKLLETAIKPMTDRAQVHDGGDAVRVFGVYPGEVYSRALLDNYNIELKDRNLRQITYEPLLMGIPQVPQHSEDFMAGLAHERIKDNLKKGPALGRSTDFETGHVLSRLGLRHFDSIDRLKRGG